MDDKIKLIVFGILILMCCMVSMYTINKEKKRWNKGNCPECGDEWKLIGISINGDRKYKCKNGHECVCTYDTDKEKGE